MKILIIEQPLNNRGDESAHRGLIKKLTKECPTIEIQILFYGRKESEINEFKVNLPNVEYINIPFPQGYRIYFVRIIKLIMLCNLPMLLYLIPKINNILLYYRSADCVMCAPGGINLGGFQDWVHLAFLYLAKIEKKEIIYFGRSIGPFCDQNYKSRLFKKQSLNLLSNFTFLSLRDHKSQLVAKELNIEFVPTIDSAFLVDVKTEIPEIVKTNFNGSDYIVVVPNSLTWHHNFKQYSFNGIRFFWVLLLERLIVEYPTYKIVMLPQTIGYSKILPDGYKYFCEIKEMCSNHDHVIVIEEKYGSDIQQAIISGAKFLIGARYHSVIFALNQGIPFISLSYEHKMNGVIELLGKQNCEIKLVNELNEIPISKVLKNGIIDRIIQLSHIIEPDYEAIQTAREISNKGFEPLKACLLKHESTVL